MQKINNKTSYLIERFYTHFLLRDLTYIFAGALFIYAVTYSLKGIGYLPKEFSFKTIAYLLMSYFIGLAISELGHFLGIVNKVPCLPKNYQNYLLLIQKLETKYHPNVLKEYERTIYLMHVGASVGVSALFGALFMSVFQYIKFHYHNICVSSDYIIAEVILALYASIMIPHSLWKTRQIEKQLYALANNLKSKKKT